MVRSRKPEKLLESRVRSWLKRQDPTYKKQISEKNKEDAIKSKRNQMSRVRRAGHSAAFLVFKNFSPLTDTNGNVYTWNSKYRRLLRNDSEVVRRARDGSIHYIPYENEEDLDDPKYDEPIYSDMQLKVVENVEKLFSGDEELDAKMKERKVVIPKKLDDDECFWKHLSGEEKREILKKLKHSVK